MFGPSASRCDSLLEAALGLQRAGDFRAAQAQVNLALNACQGPTLDRARALNRTLQPLVVAAETCDRVRREAEEQLRAGQLRQASRLAVAPPGSCASRPEMQALRRSIDTARKSAADAVAQARAEVSEGAVDSARSSLEKAGRLDRDNPDVARVTRTLEAKARELASREAMATPSQQTTPATPTSPGSPATSAAGVPQPPPPSGSADTTTAVTQMMSLAMNGNWSRLDAQVQALKVFSSGAPGDRKASRAANVEGLRLLRAGSAVAAVPVLRAGAQADPSDVEVTNNLGFALMQAGQLQEASTTLERTILMAPDRTSAWANYSETLALGGNEPGSTAALTIAVHFSADRQKSIDALAKVRETHPNAVYVRAVGKVLAEAAAIPRGPNDRSRDRPAVASTRPAGGNEQAPVPAPRLGATPVPSTVPAPTLSPAPSALSLPTPAPAPAPAVDAKRIECEVLVRGGQRALASRSYDVALQQAADAVAAYPGCPGAQELSSTARQAKDAARAGVVIR